MQHLDLKYYFGRICVLPSAHCFMIEFVSSRRLPSTYSPQLVIGYVIQSGIEKPIVLFLKCCS